MKRFTVFLLVVFLTALAVPMAAQSQQDPNTIPPHFYQPLISGKTFTNSSGDTTSAYKLGGASQLSLVISVGDSCYADVYIDKRIRGVTAWTQSYADSVVSTTDSATVKKEIVLRSTTVNQVAGLDIEIRARIVDRAAGAGTQTNTRSVHWAWKP